LFLQDPQKRHQLERKLVSEVICALCNTRQPVSPDCIACGVSFGRYVCMKCHFFDDDTTKQQFHCDDCGICRVGGRDNFFHCSTCNCCYSTSLQDGHVCVTNSMHQNCPVCFEYLFDSIRPIAVLPCGHTIHQVSQQQQLCL
jgi:RING finger/CHY zinc finger protein 1